MEDTPTTPKDIVGYFGQDTLDLAQSASEDSIFLDFDDVMDTAWYGHVLGKGGRPRSDAFGAQPDREDGQLSRQPSRQRLIQL